MRMPDIQLTADFWLSEFVRSDIAARHGIDNTASTQIIARIRHVAAALQWVRDNIVRGPITVTSGYRCPELNILVRGQLNSQHMRGEAADIIAPQFGAPRDLARAIKASTLPYDQLILEFDEWVHISVRQVYRKDELTINRKGTIEGIA